MTDELFEPLTLPCGVVLKNRIAKSAMSDSLGDGTGHPTPEQLTLYQKWADGGLAISIVGEVQGNPGFAEKPGNLVLNDTSDHNRFRELATKGGSNGTSFWLQLGHAGAMSYAPTSTPKGPSALDLPGLRCGEFTRDEIADLPNEFARTARMAKEAGFGGVQIHAAHGFLLSQFHSPLFNRRDDEYGGSIENRMRLLLDVVLTVRNAVGEAYPIAIKLNSSDQLLGGLESEDALKVIAALDNTSIDLIDISGGTYFPGAKSASDGAGKGPYFIDFARQARKLTTKPLMLTGGFKTLSQATGAVSEGSVDVVGLARAMILEPSLPNKWRKGECAEPAFPRFASNPEGGITAWYTMRITEIGQGYEHQSRDLDDAIEVYEARDRARTKIWLETF